MKLLNFSATFPDEAIDKAKWKEIMDAQGLTRVKTVFSKRIMILIAVLSFSIGISAQVNTPGQVSGLVSDSEGNPLAGVNITVKGTKAGTVSDIDGRYQVHVSGQESVLIFSYIGFSTREIPVANNKTLNVVLQDEHNALDEVVVTALGLKREKKALGYAVQDLKGDILTEVRDPNMLNSLAGQVAGVQISNSASGGLGGSPKIAIRGDVSFTNNAPLFIIDGVPLNNNSSNYNTDGMDFGSGASDINPDDVESMSILKGPTAAALYGSRAANGAVVITTKSGKKNKGLGITYNSNLVLQPRLLRTPDYQYRYGAGENFEYAYVDGNGGGINDGAGYCWGPALNQLDPNTASGFVEIPQFASPIDPATGNRIPVPWVAHRNFLEDFFETGTVFTNNISISNANENGSFRLSYTNLDQKGIMPNTDLRRNTISLSAGYNPAKFLRVNANVNYVQNKSDNMPQLNYWDKPIMYTFMWWGMNENVKALKNYWAPGKEGVEQINYNNSWMDNPYFTLYENTQSQLKNHIYGNVSFNLDIIEGLSLMGRTGTDWYDDNIRIRRAYSSRNYPNGMYAVNNYIYQERNSDFLLAWDKPNDTDFQYKVSFGGNLMRRSIRKTAAKALELEIPGIYNLENARSTPELKEENQEKAINSLYGMGQLVYKNLLYLDVTARNDWSSTLPHNNNSYFYPSVSMSGLISETVNLPKAISFLKIRGSWAQVGNDTDPYKLVNVYQFGGKWGSTSSAYENGDLLNAALKPEKINSIEFGLDLRFFGDRLGLDVAYYNTIATNQILNMSIAPSSGYSSRMINAGKIESRGVEIVLNAVPLRFKGVEWNMTLNYATNRAYVRELAEGLETYDMGYNAQARVGGRMGDLYGWGFKHAPDGQMIYGEDGLPVWEDEIKCYGNYNPDWMAGFKNTFSFKNFRLSVLFDYRKGGRIFSGTLAKGMEGGVLAESAIGNQREEGLIGEGVIAMHDGEGNVTGYRPNDVRVSLRDWIGRYHDRSAFETNSYDASYLKLREIGFSYTLPRIKLSDSYSLHNVSIGITGRNLWMWSKAKHIDPESGGSGYEDVQIPTPKSIGCNLSIIF